MTTSALAAQPMRRVRRIHMLGIGIGIGIGIGGSGMAGIAREELMPINPGLGACGARA